MKHLAVEWEKSKGVGGKEYGRPDPADDSVNGVITSIPLSLHYKHMLTVETALHFALYLPSRLLRQFHPFIYPEPTYKCLCLCSSDTAAALTFHVLCVLL